MATQIQLRRDTASNWTANNPTLAAGEFGWESDTNRFKIGTGSAAWNTLGYASEGDTAGITFVGDDSTGTTVNQNETFKIAGTQNITAVVSGDTLTLTGPDLSSYLTSVSQSDVTQHQSALSITESQISDLQSYKTAVSESDVTQHQAALSITESQISDLAHFSGSYTDLTNKPTIPSNNTELTNGAGYITASSTDTLTNKSGNVSQFTNDSGYKTSVSEADVTQHQSALSITESQITDLNHFSGSYTDLTNKPTIPTNNTELTNGAGYATTSYVDQEVAGIVDSAPEALNTLNELSAALGDDANFATTTSTALGNRLRIDTNAQGLTATQKTNAKTNLGLSTVASTGAYGDLSGLPTIPTNNNELTNGAGYITDYTVTEGDVTAHQAALSITESQISDLSHFSGSYTDLTNKPTIPTNNNELTNGAGYITASSTDTLTNKSGNVSQFTNDAGYKTAVTESDVTAHQAALSITESQISDLSHFSGSYNDLTNKPTIPTNNNELTNGAGYITDYTVTESDVTAHQAALAVTESQISDLGSYITDANITIVGDDSTGTSFSAKDNDNIKITGTQNTAVAVSGDTITVTGPDLSSYATQSYVNTQISNTVDSAPETLNTLNELAAALGDDANFATTTSTALGNRLRVDTDAQGLTSTQKSNAATNLGLNTVATSGAYSDLSGTPTIPTNNNTLTNGAGYITGYSVTEGDVTAHQAALSITESQISDLGSYITASSTDTLTNKSGNISQWTNDSGYSTFSGSYTDLTNKPTIPTNNNQLTNGAGYLTSVAFADVTSKPTTIAGYGITDAFDGAYSSLSGTPTIPSALTDLSITDGSNGQVLTTDGAGNFTFTTVSGGGSAITIQDEGSSLATAATTLNFTGSGVTASGTGATKTITIAGGGAANTGDITFSGNELSTGSSNADLELTANGTGGITLAPRGIPASYEGTVWSSAQQVADRSAGLVNSFSHKTGHAPDQRIYSYDTLYVQTDGTDTSSSNARYRKIISNTVDYNGGDMTNTSGSRGALIQAFSYAINTDSTSTSNIGNQRGLAVYGGVGNEGTSSVGDINVTNLSGASIAWEAGCGTEDISVTNATGLIVDGYAYGEYNGGTVTVANQKGISLTMSNAPTTSSIGLEINSWANTSSTTGEVYDIKTTNSGGQSRFNDLIIGADGNAKTIKTAYSNTDLKIDTQDSGHIYLDDQKWPNADGSNGQYLSTDGNGNLSWATVDALPSQSGNAGKYLTTDGTNPSWATLDISNWTADVNGGGYELSDVELTNYKEKINDRNPTGNNNPVGLTEGTITPDAADGNLHQLTLSDDITINGFANAEAGQTITLIITQPASGSHSLTSTMKFAGGNKTLTAASNAVDILTITYDGTTYWASLASDYQ